MNYTYTKAVDVERLTQEIIQESEITVALDYINLTGESHLEIFFKGTLPNIEAIVLDNLVSAHVNEPLEDLNPTVPVSFSNLTAEDGVPYVYQTTRPLGQYLTYYSGAGDTAEVRGAGDRLTFCMEDSDNSKEQSISFNEDVWIKDGFIICKDVPFGATIDISVVHPVYGVLDYFGVAIPIAGTGWFPMDTEDRAFIPAGLQVKATVRNSTPGDGHSEARPAKWYLAGRFELFRSKLTPT